MSENDQDRTDTNRPESGAEPAAPPTRAGGRNFRRILGLLIVGFVVLVALLPTLASWLFARSSVTSAMSDALGAKVELESLSVGWFSGLELRGLKIASRDGFPQDANAIELDSLTGDIGLTDLLSGKFDVRGNVDGLRVHLIQRADGSLNVEPVKSSESSGTQSSSGSDAGGNSFDLGMLRLDLTATNADIRITQEPLGMIEHFRNIESSIKKPFGTTDVDLTFGADLGNPNRPGRIDAHVDVDASFARPAELTLDTARVDLARYAPLIQAKLPGQLEEFAGTAEGKIEATVAPGKEVVCGGLLTITEPRISGPLVGGMKVRAPKWTFEPKITADLTATPPKIDTSALQVDLGFFEVRGIEATETEALLGEPGFGAQFSLDLAKVAQFGGELPPELSGDQVKMSGRIAVPPPSADGIDVQALIASLVLDGNVEVGELTYAGRGFQNVVVDANLKGGALTIASREGSSIDGGNLQFDVRADLTKLDSQPMKAKLTIDGAQLTPSDAPALRFVIPFLAGIVPDAPHVDLGGKLALALDVSGPVLPQDGETTLEWLNHFGGDGNVSLTDGVFTPAQQLRQLLEFVGQDTTLPFSTIATDFSVAAGRISSEAMNLTAKGQSFGVSGSTTLAGALDYAIDISSTLASHKDGKKVLEYIPKEQLVAKLGGTVDSPKLSAPDLGALIQSALKNTLETEAKKAIEEKAGDLLRDILRRR